MMKNVLTAIAIFADFITIASIWGINAESPLWAKIVITIMGIIIGVIVIVLTYDASDIKIKKYHYKEQENELRVYAKKNKYLIAGSIVSIYYKYVEHEEEHDDLVALGCVIKDDKNSEIKIFNIANEKLMKNIFSSNKSYRKYHIKPNVEFSRISEIVMNESEANSNV